MGRFQVQVLCLCKQKPQLPAVTQAWIGGEEPDLRSLGGPAADLSIGCRCRAEIGGWVK